MTRLFSVYCCPEHFQAFNCSLNACCCCRPCCCCCCWRLRNWTSSRKQEWLFVVVFVRSFVRSLLFQTNTQTILSHPPHVYANEHKKKTKQNGYATVEKLFVIVRMQNGHAFFFSSVVAIEYAVTLCFCFWRIFGIYHRLQPMPRYFLWFS